MNLGSPVLLEKEDDNILCTPEHKLSLIFKSPVYGSFFQDFLSCNKPCILSCGMVDSWYAVKHWIHAEGTPDLSDLCQKYGDAEVPVANCSEKYFDSQPKTQKKLLEYVSYMEHTDRNENLYLKDWHLQREQRRRRPADPPFYRTPVLFASDWLNEFWEARPERADDYRFVYVGVAGTWTPFHADVFRSFSWSANVCGTKRWILLPPGEEEKLRSLSGLPFDVASVLGAESPQAAVSSEKLRGGSEGGDVMSLELMTSPSGVRYYDVLQESGEVMFVPSGWHHQVWNVRDTVSINHNWLNAANVGHVCDHLLTSLAAVRAELSDIADDSDDWLAQCQTLLRATHGMDLAEFAELLCFTAERRLVALRDGSAVSGLDGWRYDRAHMLWDVRRVGRTLQRLLQLEEFSRLHQLQQWRAEAERLIGEIGVFVVPLDGRTSDTLL